VANRIHLARGDEEFYGVRAWREGMSLRRVHWRLSARRGRRIVREMRSEEDAPIHLMLVTVVPSGMPVEGPRRRFERAVSLAATLAEHFLRAGRRVRLSLLDSAGERAPTSESSAGAWRGRAGLLGVLVALAEAEPRFGALRDVELALGGMRASRSETKLAIYVGDGASNHVGGGVGGAPGWFAIDVEHPDASRLFSSGRRWGMGAPLGLRTSGGAW
jgi:uncharacterized protein (DUF58 family)